MSASYNLEPSPTAKVVLHTSSGDLYLELFANQTPLAARNFIQLCLDGYYDNTIFHRLVPGFVIQGGDPSGTGAGGESSFEGGQPFQDEFHSRLKFNRRGLLGMANGGSKNDNGSQFFLTLAKTEELQNKHTLFGRLEGDTIYNLVRMGEAELTDEEGSNRPIYPTRIVGTEVLVNPFGDIARRTQAPEIVAARRSIKKKKSKQSSSKQLLSFEGAEGDEIASPKLRKAHPSLVESNNAQVLSSRSTDLLSTQRDCFPADVTTESPTPPALSSLPIPSQARPPESHTIPPLTSDSPLKLTQDEQLKETKLAIEKLKASMKREVLVGQEDEPRKHSALQRITPSTAIKGRKRKHSKYPSGESSAEEQRILNAFNAFRAKLDEINQSKSPPIYVQSSSQRPSEDVGKLESLSKDTYSAIENTRGVDDEEIALCDLHFIPNCQSCLKWDEESGVDDSYHQDDTTWMSHQLTFGKDRRGKDLEWKRQNNLILEVIDPLTRAKEIQKYERQPRS